MPKKIYKTTGKTTVKSRTSFNAHIARNKRSLKGKVDKFATEQTALFVCSGKNGEFEFAGSRMFTDHSKEIAKFLAQFLMPGRHDGDKADTKSETSVLKLLNGFTEEMLVEHTSLERKRGLVRNLVLNGKEQHRSVWGVMALAPLWWPENIPFAAPTSLAEDGKMYHNSMTLSEVLRAAFHHGLQSGEIEVGEQEEVVGDREEAMSEEEGCGISREDSVKEDVQVGEQDEVVREQEEVIGDSVEAMLEGEGGGVSREVSVKEHGQICGDGDAGVVDLTGCQNEEDAVVAKRLRVCREDFTFSLSEHSEQLLTDNSGWLDGDVIDCVLQLLKRERKSQSWVVWPTRAGQITHLQEKESINLPRFDPSCDEGVLLPLNTGSHWVLLVLCVDHAMIMDSLPCHLETARRHIGLMYQLLGISEPSIIPKKVPRQTNGDDCGVCVMAFARWILMMNQKTVKQTDFRQTYVRKQFHELIKRVLELEEGMRDKRAQAARLMLHVDCKEVEFEYKMYQQGDAPDFIREEWLKEKFTLRLDEELKKAFLEGIQERLDKFTAWLGEHDYFGGSEIQHTQVHFTMAPTLGYWKIRGLAHAARLMLHYKEVEFEDNMYQQGEAPDFSREIWLKEKFNLGLDLPNLPYYIDGDVKITETSAIMAYIGRKYNLCGSTEEARVRNDISYSLQLFNRQDYIQIVYNPNCEELKKAFTEGLQERLDKFTAWLGEHDYFGGSELVYADFNVYELLDVWKQFVPGCMDKCNKLNAYMSRIEALPTIKAYLASEGYMKKGPFNGTIAHWGAKAVE